MTIAARGYQDESSTNVAPATHNCPVHATGPTLAPNDSVAVQADNASKSMKMTRATVGVGVNGNVGADLCRGRAVARAASAA